MPQGNIALLVPDGPQGRLERRVPVPNELLAFGEVPIQRGYRYLEDAEHNFFMSVWDSTPVTTKIHIFPRNEFFRVVNGSVTIIDAAGRENTFHAGDCFIFPQGLKSVWKQTEYFRKYAVGFTDASGQEPVDPSDLGVVRLDPSGMLEASAGSPAESLLGPAPVQHERRWFADTSGQMTVRVWDTTACQHKPRIAEAHEWTHVLDGAVTLTDAAGMAHHFKKGDTYIVSLGTVYGWQCPGYFRAVHCAFQPKAAEAKSLAAE